MSELCTWSRLSDGVVTRLAGGDAATVSWGIAEFVAAEEMERDRGYWWAPDGETLLVARVDEAPVSELWITDAARPGTPPHAVRYPTAGSPNASVDAYLVAPRRGRPCRSSGISFAFRTSARRSGMHTGR